MTNSNILKIKNELYFYNLNKEEKQSKYLKSLQSIKNTKTGEVFKLTYNFDSKQKEYVKTLEQKVHALTALANFENLIPLFLTLTLPSKYHPFKTLKNGQIILNKNFIFKSLDKAIEEGYNNLKEIYRIFYKRLKNITKNIYYIKIVEPHKSLIPHMHIMIFIPKKHLITVKNLFFKVCKENELRRVEFDESIFKENINNVVGYILKYILKTLNSNDDFFKRWIDGWRKKYRIRGCELSNLIISVEIYKKLYYNLPINLKESIQKEIENKKQSFFEYFINNTEVTQIIYKE